MMYQYKYWVKIYQNKYTEDDQGGRQKELDKIGEFWAAVEPLRIKEQYEAMMKDFNEIYSVRIRTDKDIQPGMVMELFGKFFEIKSVMDTMDTIFEKSLICEEIRA